MIVSEKSLQNLSDYKQILSKKEFKSIKNTFFLLKKMINFRKLCSGLCSLVLPRGFLIQRAIYCVDTKTYKLTKHTKKYTNIQKKATVITVYIFAKYLSNINIFYYFFSWSNYQPHVTVQDGPEFLPRPSRGV